MTAYERYRKKALVPFQLMLNRNTDRDILEWMEKQPSKAGAVKAAIRAAMLSAPAPESAPAPALEPAPESAPAPALEPAPESAPAPAPALEPAPEPVPAPAPVLEPAPEPVPEPAPEIWWYDNLDDKPTLTEFQQLYTVEWQEKRGGVRECVCYAVGDRRLTTEKKVKAAFLARRPKNAPHAFHLDVTKWITLKRRK